jgi:hypothetical protein
VTLKQRRWPDPGGGGLNPLGWPDSHDGVIQAAKAGFHRGEEKKMFFIFF